MAECDRCGAFVLGEYGETNAGRDRPDADCPVCLLERAAPGQVPEDVDRAARSALSFETTGELRGRILELVAADVVDDRSRGFRTSELRAVAAAVDASTGSPEGLTNRELRASIADRIGIDANTSGRFRKDDLVEIVVFLLEHHGDPESDTDS